MADGQKPSWLRDEEEPVPGWLRSDEEAIPGVGESSSSAQASTGSAPIEGAATAPIPPGKKDQEKPSAGGAFLRNAGQGFWAGAVDEVGGFLRNTFTDIGEGVKLGSNFQPSPEDTAEEAEFKRRALTDNKSNFQIHRNQIRDLLADDRKYEPGATVAGDFVGSGAREGALAVMTGGQSFNPAVRAGLGGAEALARSEAELAGDGKKDYGTAALETGVGASLGALLPAGLKAAPKTVGTALVASGATPLVLNYLSGEGNSRADYYEAASDAFGAAFGSLGTDFHQVRTKAAETAGVKTDRALERAKIEGKYEDRRTRLNDKNTRLDEAKVARDTSLNQRIDRTHDREADRIDRLKEKAKRAEDAAELARQAANHGKADTKDQGEIYEQRLTEHTADTGRQVGEASRGVDQTVRGHEAAVADELTTAAREKQKELAEKLRKAAWQDPETVALSAAERQKTAEAELERLANETYFKNKAQQSKLRTVERVRSEIDKAVAEYDKLDVSEHATYMRELQDDYRRLQELMMIPEKDRTPEQNSFADDLLGKLSASIQEFATEPRAKERAKATVDNRRVGAAQNIREKHNELAEVLKRSADEFEQDARIENDKRLLLGKGEVAEVYRRFGFDPGDENAIEVTRRGQEFKLTPEAEGEYFGRIRDTARNLGAQVGDDWRFDPNAPDSDFPLSIQQFLEVQRATRERQQSQQPPAPRGNSKPAAPFENRTAQDPADLEQLYEGNTLPETFKADWRSKVENANAKLSTAQAKQSNVEGHLIDKKKRVAKTARTAESLETRATKAESWRDHFRNLVADPEKATRGQSRERSRLQQLLGDTEDKYTRELTDLQTKKNNLEREFSPEEIRKEGELLLETDKDIIEASKPGGIKAFAGRVAETLIGDTPVLGRFRDMPREKVIADPKARFAHYSRVAEVAKKDAKFFKYAPALVYAATAMDGEAAVGIVESIFAQDPEFAAAAAASQ